MFVACCTFQYSSNCVDLESVSACTAVCRHYADLLQIYSSPVEGSKQLHFDDKYPKPLIAQFWAIFAKYMAAYWRMPDYNATRILLALGVGFVFGAMFWRLGDKV